MQSHRTILGHAEAATTRLLKRVVDAAGDFDLIEIEGDAAFLSREADPLDGEAMSPSSPTLSSPCTARSTWSGGSSSSTCAPATSCTQTSELKLKFVAHVGEVAIQKIKRRRKLVGIDVIFVHRLLKNPVQVSEYVLVSEELYQTGGMSPSDHSVHEIVAGPRGNRTRAHLLRGDRGPRRAPRSDPGSLVAAAGRRDRGHAGPGAAVQAPPATST